jgi:UDP-N-acetylglucosamine--N-acetylmuramyl-(pentapeptide) pyrophosphoryl-undecaprenol N-acetylglucosamine transferase
MSLIVLAAGGTGGHLFPAQALAEELVMRGHDVQLVTDERVADYGASFPASATHIIPSATLTLRNPLRLLGQSLHLLRGLVKARSLLKRLRPAAVIGFGGYPSLPPVLAAAQLRIACAVHDQNSVMGRANRFLSRHADAVASSFPDLIGMPPSARRKLVLTGNPVRQIVIHEAHAPYPSRDGGFHLLVFGGSQGARFFAEFMPEVTAALPPDVKARLSIVQQCRPEDMASVQAAYQKSGVTHSLSSFFNDMPKRIAASHLVVCRAGASTIAELGVIGRPAIMVPLPHALDNDQLRNAESFAKAGAGWVKPQASLEPGPFARLLQALIEQPEKLTSAAAAALGHGKPDAAQRLADLAERLAQGKQQESLRP